LTTLDQLLADVLCSATSNTKVLELSVRWYTVVYILGVYIECLPRVAEKIKSSTSTVLQYKGHLMATKSSYASDSREDYGKYVQVSAISRIVSFANNINIGCK
jgi:hypothetical protein